MDYEHYEFLRSRKDLEKTCKKSDLHLDEDINSFFKDLIGRNGLTINSLRETIQNLLYQGGGF
jgi:hypothetical protein